MMSDWTSTDVDGSQTESESDEDLMIPNCHNSCDSTPGSQKSISPLVEESANEVLVAAVSFLENLLEEEARVGIQVEFSYE
jgi:hypothetical protein